MYKQAVLKFYQGSFDKEAGQYASIRRPQNMEEGLDCVRWYKHNNQAIFRKSSAKVSQISYNTEVNYSNSETETETSDNEYPVTIRKSSKQQFRQQQPPSTKWFQISL